MGNFRHRMVATLTRLYPFYSGCGTMANCGVVRALAGRLAGRDWVRLRLGPYLRVQLGDYLSNAVYFSLDWDRKISWVCERLLRPGDTALDIGANLGLVTCQMAALVGPTGKVHAFEPNPAMTHLLKQSVNRNSFAHVTVHPIALGDAEGELELTIPPETQCLATFSRDAQGHKIWVPVKTLSGCFPGYSTVTSIRLMKLDVEGFEERVFRGAEQLFRKARPNAVLFELNDYNGPFEEHPSVRFLRRHDYDFLMLPRKLLRMSAQRFLPGVTGSPSNDLIAVHRGASYDEVLARLN
jgi:FkbM family methyltransferase